MRIIEFTANLIKNRKCALFWLISAESKYSLSLSCPNYPFSGNSKNSQNYLKINSKHNDNNDNQCMFILFCTTNSIECKCNSNTQTMRISNDEKDKEAIELSKRSESWLFNNDPLTTNIYELTSNEANDFIIDRSKKAQTLDYDKKDRKKCGLCKQLWIGVAAVLVIGCVYFKNDIIGVMNHNHSTNQAAMQRKILAEVPVGLWPPEFVEFDITVATGDAQFKDLDKQMQPAKLKIAPILDGGIECDRWHLVLRANGGKEYSLSQPMSFHDIYKSAEYWWITQPADTQELYRADFQKVREWYGQYKDIKRIHINQMQFKRLTKEQMEEWLEYGPWHQSETDANIYYEEHIGEKGEAVIRYLAKEDRYYTSWISSTAKSFEVKGRAVFGYF